MRTLRRALAVLALCSMVAPLAAPVPALAQAIPPTPPPQRTPLPVATIPSQPQPAPKGAPQPTPRGAAQPMAVLGSSLSWPDGSYRYTVSSGSVPHPVAVVRVDRPGTLIVQWKLDGAPLRNETRLLGAGGDARFTLLDPLPAGSHSVSIAVLSPPSIGFSGPAAAPAISYGPANAPVAAPVANTGFYNGPVPTVDWNHVVDIPQIRHGKIALDTPQYGKHQEGEFTTDYGIPMLDDSLSFTWHELNPGTADSFEFHLLDANGKIILRRRLDPSVTYLVPDSAFLADALRPTSPAKVGTGDELVVASTTLHGLGTGTASHAPFNAQLHQLLAQADLSWEVRGYQHVAGSDVEVEISEQWPLQKPDDAGGIGACNPDTTPSVGGIQIYNTATQTSGRPAGVKGAPPSSGSTHLRAGALRVVAPRFAGSGSSRIAINFPDQPPPPPTDTNNYVYDPIALNGPLDLSHSPYHAHPDVHTKPEPGVFAPPIESIDFPNVFVDWGDGTVDPITTLPSGSMTGSYAQRSSGDPIQIDDTRMQHKYVHKNTYIVRVFQISEGDGQHLSAGQLGLAIDGSALLATSPYFALSSAASGAAAASAHALGAPASSYARATMPTGTTLSNFGSHRFAAVLAGGTPAAGDVVQRAYVLSCQKLLVQDGIDNTATGPLKLRAVALNDFGSHTVGPPGVPRPNGLIGAIDRLSVGFTGAPSSQLSTRSAAARSPSIPRGSQGPVYGRATTCDVDLSANGALEYYGRGDALVTWYIGDVSLGARRISDLSSPFVAGLGRGDKTAIDPKPGQIHALTGSVRLAPDRPFNTDTLGTFTVHISVEVKPADITSPNVGIALAGGRFRGTAPLKVGFLSPLATPIAGLNSVAYVSSAVHASDTSMTHVNSNPGIVSVGASDTTEPCKFLFATSHGDFTVSGLQHNLTKSGTHYNGRGTLLVNLVPDSQGAVERSIPIAIDNWDVPDGLHVKNGRIDVGSPSDVQAMPFAGASASVARIHAQTDGTGSSPMLVTMAFALRDQLLRSTNGSSALASFAPLEAPLDTDGNWISGKTGLPPTELGNSGLVISGDGVIFDYSVKQGAPATGACDGSDPAFVGVNLALLDLRLNTLNLKGTSSPVQPANWVIDDGGLCGRLSADPNFKARDNEGYVSIPHVDIDVAQSEVNATYRNIDVHVPWLDEDLRGDATLVTTGEARLGLTAAPVRKQYGPLTMNVDNIAFMAEHGVGWTVVGDAHFDFANGSVAFTHADVPNIFFTLGGRPTFDGGSTTKDVPLSGSTKFNQTSLDLKSLHLVAARSGDDQLAFEFGVGARISDAIPEGDTHVHYDIRRAGSGFTVAAPSMDAFATEVVLPVGQPVIDSKMSPHYEKTPAGDDRFTADVDLGMFSGPPVRAQFVLGFTQGTDYWVVRGDAGFPGSGVPLAPGVDLYKIGGGLGYHVHVDNPEELKTAAFDRSRDLVFLAGLIVGSPDDAYTYWLNGQFSVYTGSFLARMDYQATLLSNDHALGSGTTVAQFDGYFQYGGGAFDGRLEGKLQPPGLGGAIYATIPGPHYGGGEYAAGMHFDSNAWHIYLGTKGNPIIGHVIVMDTDSWFDLGSFGLDVGAGEHYDLEAGGSAVGAYLKGDLETELVITPAPHVAGDGSGQLDVGACLAICFDVNVDAHVHVEAMPIHARGDAHVHVSTPWPLPDIDIGVSASL